MGSCCYVEMLPASTAIHGTRLCVVAVSVFDAPLLWGRALGNKRHRQGPGDRYGADYEILEASDRIGGRTQRLHDFMDFPIDLGAEWIHTDPGVLSRLVDDETVEGDIDVVRYTPETYGAHNGGGTVFVSGRPEGRFVRIRIGGRRLKPSSMPQNARCLDCGVVCFSLFYRGLF